MKRSRQGSPEFIEELRTNEFLVGQLVFLDILPTKNHIEPDFFGGNSWRFGAESRQICYTEHKIFLGAQIMPTISMFYGIIIRMLFMDKQQHNLPHLHVEYQGQKASISMPDRNLLDPLR